MTTDLEEDPLDTAPASPEPIVEWQPTHGGLRGRLADGLARRGAARLAVTVGAVALGAVAIGTLAIGSLAIGAIAIGRLKIGRVRLGEVEIDWLIVKRLDAAK